MFRLFRIGIIALGVAGYAMWHSDQQTSSPANAHTDTLKGFARVIDGDTFAIGETHIRLAGVDTPESCQKGYSEAKVHLAFLVQGATVMCRPSGKSYARVVAFCFTSVTADLSEKMAKDGYAVDWPKFSKGAYADEQADAVRSKRGLWKHLKPWRPAETHHVCP